MINVPNTITVARVFLALGTLYLLWLPGDTMRWAAFACTILVIWADGLDGFFARRLNQSSKLGGILDIAGDRVVELSYWIVFSVLNWIPLWVPLLFLFRGTFVDAIRSHVSEKGYTAFGAKTMMQSPVGKLLVASNFSRFTYAVVKAAAFCLIIASHTARFENSVLPTVAIWLVYGSTVFCLIRGLPVFFEGDNIFVFKAMETHLLDETEAAK